MCHAVITLNFLLNDKSGKRELIEFIKWIDKNDFNEVYCVNSSIKRIIWSAIKYSNFLFYSLISFLAKFNFKYIKKAEQFKNVFLF